MEWQIWEQRLKTLLKQLPMEEVIIPLKSRSWNLTLVRSEEAILTFSEHLEHFPFGFLLWESAMGVAEYIEANPALVAGKNILELGAGLGFAGMVAQSLGGNVCQTDHQLGALTIARWNAQKNGITEIEYRLADWRDWNSKKKYDVILGADILYDRKMHFYLEEIFRHYLRPKGCLLLSDPKREQAFQFITHLENRGWRFTIMNRSIPKEFNPANGEMDVLIYEGRFG
ncbi:MAG: methyltransferase domain-containing protein [Armatimonadetes bacterium]|nr:methyltransferase domain-containing protein [Armatimonadota bacterium]